MYQRAAKSSRVAVDGTSLAYASWAVNVTGDDLETNNFNDYDEASGQAYNEGIIGFLGAAGDFGGDWDASLNPVDFSAQAPPGLYPRDDLADVEFTPSLVDAITPYSFPYVRILTSNVGAKVTDLVTFTCTYRNQGIFDFPTGSS